MLRFCGVLGMSLAQDVGEKASQLGDLRGSGPSRWGHQDSIGFDGNKNLEIRGENTIDIHNSRDILRFDFICFFNLGCFAWFVVGHVAGCDVLEQLKQWKANELDLVDCKVESHQRHQIFRFGLAYHKESGTYCKDIPCLKLLKDTGNRVISNGSCLFEAAMAEGDRGDTKSSQQVMFRWWISCHGLWGNTALLKDFWL